MSDSKYNISIGSPGLFIVFLVLKLTDVIDWSWWWITAPIWGGLAIVAILLIVVGIIWVIAECL